MKRRENGREGRGEEEREGREEGRGTIETSPTFCLPAPGVPQGAKGTGLGGVNVYVSHRKQGHSVSFCKFLRLY